MRGFSNRELFGDHFERTAANVAATYAVLIGRAGRLGRIKEEAKKTSIHLVRKTAFAGVAVQKKALVLTLKSNRDVHSKRLERKQQVSANRWHIEVRLERPDEVDQEILRWLERAYSLSG